MIALITVQPYWMEKVLVHVMDFLPANQYYNSNDISYLCCYILIRKKMSLVSHCFLSEEE